ncbi:MAG: hypothetical protein AAB215_05225, partial [Planctomycetota bacterium]
MERFYGRAEKDTFRVHYKANSRRALNRLAAQAGFAPNVFQHIGDPSYVAFNELAFRAGMLIDRISDWGRLKETKAHIVACYVKRDARCGMRETG